MPIILRLDRVMADRKMSLKELSEKVGVANVNLSKLKNGHVSAIRFSTLEAICEALDCQPGRYPGISENGGRNVISGRIRRNISESKKAAEIYHSRQRPG